MVSAKCCTITHAGEGKSEPAGSGKKEKRARLSKLGTEVLSGREGNTVKVGSGDNSRS